MSIYDLFNAYKQVQLINCLVIIRHDHFILMSTVHVAVNLSQLQGPRSLVLFNGS